MRSSTLQNLSCVDAEGAPAPLDVGIVRELLTAVPQLRALHCNLARSTPDEEEVAKLLRREGPFAAVRLSSALLFLSGETEEHAVNALKGHDGLEDLTLVGGPAVSIRAFAAALDAAAAIKVARLTLCAHSDLSCAALARLVSAGALRELTFVGCELPEADVTELAEALRKSTLTSITFLQCEVLADVTQAARLVLSLAGHPTLAEVSFDSEEVPEEIRVRLSGAFMLHGARRC